jgi:DNA-binding transcriptional regulator YiaG
MAFFADFGMAFRILFSMPAQVPALVKPQFIRLSRTSAGMDVAQAARKARISEEKLQAWETEKDRPNVIQLRKPGDIYKRPLTTTEQPTHAEIRAAIDAATPIEHVFEFARIQRTTRAQYRVASGTENVEEPRGCTLCASSTSRAWNSDRNELMIAWAKTNL